MSAKSSASPRPAVSTPALTRSRSATPSKTAKASASVVALQDGLKPNTLVDAVIKGPETSELETKMKNMFRQAKISSGVKTDHVIY
jgi:hypothetical protein